MQITLQLIEDITMISLGSVQSLFVPRVGEEFIFNINGSAQSYTVVKVTNTTNGATLNKVVLILQR